MSSNEPKKRLKAAESRRALLDAGLELLKLRGVAPGLDRVTLKEAIEVSGVPRSTAYRLYEGGKGQLEEFRADLLFDLDRAAPEVSIRSALDQVFADVEPLVASNDPVKLAQALREIVRVVVNAGTEAMVESVEWRVFMSSLASLGTGVDRDPQLAESFGAASHRFGDQFVELFDVLSNMFGIRTRDPLSTAELGVIIGAVAEGATLRQGVDSALGCIKRPTGPNGDLQNWNAAGVAVEGLLLSMTEPTPGAQVSADLSSWM